MHLSKRSVPGIRLWLLAAVMLLSWAGGSTMAATTTLSNLPLYSASNVPANLMLALSVEFPTAVVAAYKDANGIPLVYTDDKGVVQTINSCGGTSNNIGTCYYPAMRYLGYFDNTKCYTYDAVNNYFVPKSVSTDCSGQWSGNMLNWALMTSLDEFRQSLTGGTRYIDTATTTVLVRSALGSQSSLGNFPDRQLDSSKNVAPSTVTPYTGSTLYIRSYNQGTQFLISNNTSFGGDATKGQYLAALSARVQVCVAGLLESNCKAYGTNYKPEGLIQQNFERIRVGASAYTYKFTDTNAKYPNGAVRALLRDNGPTKYNGNGARLNNPNKEWSADDGTFYQNPAGSDPGGLTAAGTAPSDSGVINYLNKFGTTNNYERYDTIADLYWATLAYYMQVPLADAYTSYLTASNSLDTTFPVFKATLDTNKNLTVNDPIAYTCQANAILMIGDSHTHCDSAVPTSGGPVNANSGTCEAINRTTLPVTNGADAALYAGKLGDLPLVEADPATGAAASVTMNALMGSSIGSRFEPGAGTDATYNMAGLAYFAHTQDIRPDTGAKLAGKQTVDTYVVDVMEPSTYSGAKGYEIFSTANAAGNHGPNMYWLAAKYGGFNDINNDGKPASFLTWHTNTSTAKGLDLRPDNYFIGNRPDLIVAGLSSIFNNVSSTKSLSAAGPSVSPSRVLTNVSANTPPYNSPKEGFPTYATSYLPGIWSGDVIGYVAGAVVGANVTPVAGGNQWSAATQLATMAAYTDTSKNTVGWKNLRRIITINGTGGVPFNWNNLSSTQKADLNNDSTLLDFLRGDRSNEGTKFDTRGALLGDIVNSQATLVQGASNTSYTDVNNPGYSTFVAKVKNRAPVVYTGANDGMLHAFAADFSAPTVAVPFAGGGQELYAYVPNLVLDGPSGTPLVDGIGALGNLKGVTANGYVHHFYVDQTPQVADVDFGWTVNTPGTAGARPTTNDWHTVLIGGLGKGGRGIYALDITDVPTPIDVNQTDATTLATKAVLWEFTAPDMGYSFARPLIAKTRKYGWVVILASGYNNSTGKGNLYIINVKTGKLLETLTTTAGTPGNPSGLSRPSGFVQDVADNTVEQVYAGDLLGNVWRFDLSGTAAYPAPTLFGTLTDSKGNAQPVTTAPRIELDFSGSNLDTRRWVFVGTGKFLDTSDLTNTQTQTMYALRDGSGSTPQTTGLPRTRADLVKNDLTTNLNLQDGSAGWYYDLTGKVASDTSATERIVVDPDAVAGIFAINWATLIPTTDPCSLKGAIYSSTFASGQTNLVGATGQPTTSIATDSATTSLQAVQLPGGAFVLLYGQTSSLPATANMSSGGTTVGVTRTNWREILNN